MRKGFNKGPSYEHFPEKYVTSSAQMGFLLDSKGRSYRKLKETPLGKSGGVVHVAEVRIQEGEPLENALRRFKRKVQQEDIIKEVKRHSFYLKPGERKRVKEALARKRNRKKARKEQD
jgi:small subunit ribosomal protein S21